MNRGLFHYDVTTCETKVIEGRYGFIAQINEGRHIKKRPTEFRVDQVLQPFDENKFNFTKVVQEEVLFRFEESKDNKSDFFPSILVDADSGSPSVVAINVSNMALLVLYYSLCPKLKVQLSFLVCPKLRVMSQDQCGKSHYS